MDAEPASRTFVLESTDAVVTRRGTQQMIVVQCGLDPRRRLVDVSLERAIELVGRQPELAALFVAPGVDDPGLNPGQHQALLGLQQTFVADLLHLVGADGTTVE